MSNWMGQCNDLFTLRFMERFDKENRIQVGKNRAHDAEVDYAPPAQSRYCNAQWAEGPFFGGLILWRTPPRLGAVGDSCCSRTEQQTSRNMRMSQLPSSVRIGMVSFSASFQVLHETVILCCASHRCGPR